MTAGNGTSPNGPDGNATQAAPAALQERLADTEDRLRHRIAELTAALEERRALQADLALRADWLESMRRALDAALDDLASTRDELNRCRAERDAAIAERDGAEAAMAELRRDATLLDNLRRSAHRLPLYLRVGHPLLRSAVARRSGESAQRK